MKPGHTVLELIIASALIAIVVAVIYLTYNVGIKIFSSEVLRSDILGEGTRALERMGNELRGALKINSAGSQNLTFWYKDLNSNGSQEASETITYSWSGTPQDSLLRTVVSQSETLSNNIQSFSFTYDNPSDINLVTITLTVKKGEEEKMLKSSIKLRNL